MRRLVLVALLAALALPVVGTEPASAGQGIISESPGCGYPRFYLPDAGRRGSLPDSFPVRGPAGSLFGRTLGAVRSQLVWWDVPMSNGARVQVHRRLLPVLADVRANLQEAAGRGLHYRVRASDTWGFNARTSVAHSAISYHGLGAAIDINASSNPYRQDGRLVTDMPDWFVAAWEDAGMCWGGNWRSVKDAMHFSWVGPAASPAYPGIPTPVPPLTSSSAWNSAAGSHEVVFGRNDNPQIVVDASGNGAADVAHLRPWRDGAAVLELATSRRGYAECSIWRWWLGEPPPGAPMMADIAGTGRPDLLFLDRTGDGLVLHRYAAADDYERRSPVTTPVPTTGEFVFGDIDRDGAADLWHIEPDDSELKLTVWSSDSSFTVAIAETHVPDVTVSPDTRFATADRDVDGRADLLIVDGRPTGSTIRVVPGADPTRVAETVAGPPIEFDDQIGFYEYDGDGRPDLHVFGSDGALRSFYGNTVLAGQSPTTWFLPADFDCPDDTLPYFHTGAFADDDDSVYEGDIDWLGETGITRGCNPPFEDRFCPEQRVTRGQMAAFLVRALGLPPGQNRFIDDDGHAFEDDIAALAAVGITRGCNPPTNDRFCPDQPVTRGQMAAFLTRALGLAAAANTFVDDDGTVFEGDIGALAAVGITRGCNPPSNDRFCPDQPITRGQMAAFLHRAGPMLPVADGRP